MIAFRSLVFNIAFYVNLALFLVLGAGFFLTPRKWSIRALQAWARTSLWLLRVICGHHIEVRGMKIFQMARFSWRASINPCGRPSPSFPILMIPAWC